MSRVAFSTFIATHPKLLVRKHFEGAMTFSTSNASRCHTFQPLADCSSRILMLPRGTEVAPHEQLIIGKRNSD